MHRDSGGHHGTSIASDIQHNARPVRAVSHREQSFAIAGHVWLRAFAESEDTL
jgi:hypothetical protein